ncbi:MAG: class I SAM-dependent methyltransferase [Candidatus Thorarchaeota archaeon]
MTVFDELALAYDNTIDWKSRLEREMPFIITSIVDTDRGRALDIACGSGRHAIELAKKGFAVSAFDNSQSMIAAAKQHAHSQGLEIDFRVLSMQDMNKVYHGGFSLVLCLGNSLALLPSIAALKQMIASIHEQMLSNGVLIFQTLNFEAVEEQGIRFMPSKTGVLSTGEKVTFSRFLDYTQGDAEKAILVLSSLIESDDAKPVVESQEVLRITGPLIEESLSDAGFTTYEVFSDYASSPFQREFDRSIVVRAIK